MLELGMRSYLLQWNPINMVTTRINGVAVLPW